MKKRICYVLILCLLVSLFAGCTEKQPATSTDVTPFESNDTQTQEPALTQEQPLADESSEQAQLNQEENKQTVQKTQVVKQSVQKNPTGKPSAESNKKPAPSNTSKPSVASNPKQPPTQSVVQQPKKEPNKEVNGTPAPPLSFRSGDVLGEFKKWIETVPLIPEDVQAGSEAYYYYLKPELQEMLLNERYYLLPTAPQGCMLRSIWIYPLSIMFVYETQDGCSVMFGYDTMRNQIPTTLSSQNQKFVKFGDVQYMQTNLVYNDGTTELQLQRNYDKYTITIRCKNIDKSGMTPEKAAELFTFTKVKLPPLKEVS